MNFLIVARITARSNVKIKGDVGIFIRDHSDRLGTKRANKSSHISVLCIRALVFAVRAMVETENLRVYIYIYTRMHQ